MPRPRKDGTPARGARKRTLKPRIIRSLKPERDHGLWWDEDTAGLALSVRPSGSMSWKFIYAFRGRSRWYTIGDGKALGIADARKRARALRVQVDDDKDPQALRKSERSKGTFEELATRYVEEHAKKKNKSWQQADALVKAHLLPPWGKLRPTDITRDDVKKVMARCKPSVANQLLASASPIFTWAIKEEIGGLKENPCRLVDRNETHARERVLSNSELAAFVLQRQGSRGRTLDDARQHDNDPGQHGPRGWPYRAPSRRHDELLRQRGTDDRIVEGSAVTALS